MILTLAGTSDGRRLAEKLASLGYSIIVSVASQYGKSLINFPGVSVNSSRLSADEMAELIASKNIKLVIDASHPYAAAVSRNAIEAARKTGVNYLRYERPFTSLPEYEKIYLVKDTAEAAKTTAKLGQVIFLTTGSRELRKFMAAPEFANNRRHRIIARVLPQPEVLAECFEIGFTPKDVIAMQGPFSKELNVALFREFGAQVIVTKNSGHEGGADTKIAAAIELGLSLVVIDRPDVAYGNICCSEDEVITRVKTLGEE